ncbi:hypothetical protein V8C26DRAFT_415577 [Trichoderma gracile]
MSRTRFQDKRANRQAYVSCFHLTPRCTGGWHHTPLSHGYRTSKPQMANPTERRDGDLTPQRWQTGGDTVQKSNNKTSYNMCVNAQVKQLQVGKVGVGVLGGRRRACDTCAHANQQRTKQAGLLLAPPGWTLNNWPFLPERASKRGCQDISPIGSFSLMWLAGENLVCETHTQKKKEEAGAAALTNWMRTVAICLQTGHDEMGEKQRT